MVALPVAAATCGMGLGFTDSRPESGALLG